jgi:DNA-binding NarL/FixJ family response regulator
MSDAGLFLSLTDRQREILSLAVQGASTPRIASRLRLPETTVRCELDAFMQANKLTSREQVGAVAVRAGIS